MAKVKTASRRYKIRIDRPVQDSTTEDGVGGYNEQVMPVLNTWASIKKLSSRTSFRSETDLIESSYTFNIRWVQGLDVNAGYFVTVIDDGRVMQITQAPQDIDGRRREMTFTAVQVG